MKKLFEMKIDPGYILLENLLIQEFVEGKLSPEFLKKILHSEVFLKEEILLKFNFDNKIIEIKKDSERTKNEGFSELESIFEKITTWITVHNYNAFLIKDVLFERSYFTKDGLLVSHKHNYSANYVASDFDPKNKKMYKV